MFCALPWQCTTVPSGSPTAGTNHPRSFVPSLLANVTSSYARPKRAGVLYTRRSG